METAQAGRGSCAPGEQREPDFGELVRLKCSPQSGPYVLIAKLTEEHANGATTRLFRLSTFATAAFLVDPVHVFVAPGDYPEPLYVRAPAPEPEAPASANVRESNGLRWIESSGHPLVSEDGRFVITLGVAGMFEAFDKWTGESERFWASANAQAWCGHRTDGAVLEFKKQHEALVAEIGGSHFIVFRTEHGSGGWYGNDVRFTPDTDYRLSPLFPTEELARQWCAIRACCSVRDADGNTKLTYQIPVPF